MWNTNQKETLRFICQSLGPHHCDPNVFVEEAWAAHKANSNPSLFQPLSLIL
jgi:hypothetical protein